MSNLSEEEIRNKKFIYFLLDEFIDNIDTEIYYDKYENMDKDSLYYYFKGKFDERVLKDE